MVPATIGGSSAYKTAADPKADPRLRSVFFFDSTEGSYLALEIENRIALTAARPSEDPLSILFSRATPDAEVLSTNHSEGEAGDTDRATVTNGEGTVGWTFVEVMR